MSLFILSFLLRFVEQKYYLLNCLGTKNKCHCTNILYKVNGMALKLLKVKLHNIENKRK